MPLSKQALSHLYTVLESAGEAGMSTAELASRSKPFAARKVRRPLSAPNIAYHKGRYYASSFAPSPPTPEEALRDRMYGPKGRLTAFGRALIDLADICQQAGPNGLRHDLMPDYLFGQREGIGTFELNSVGIIRTTTGYVCKREL